MIDKSNNSECDTHDKEKTSKPQNLRDSALKDAQPRCWNECYVLRHALLGNEKISKEDADGNSRITCLTILSLCTTL